MGKQIVIKKITDIEDIKRFHGSFNHILGYSTIPLEYFMSGECHCMYDNGRLVAGFCLVNGFSNLRSVRQIPKENQNMLALWLGMDIDRLVDFTGYFISNKKKYGLKFSWYLVKTCIRHKCKYFIYSYQTTEYGLERYYGSGYPLRIHTGKPCHLEGHHDNMLPEHVEILTKMGIVRIFIYRTLRAIKSWISK